jgi:hypothetical protein
MAERVCLRGIKIVNLKLSGSASQDTGGRRYTTQ